MEKLTSWVGLGSEVFPNELRHAVRTRDEAVLGQDRLTVEQQKRSIRLLHILRQTFAGHDKSSLILQNYVEGEQSYQQSGFVALRLLAKEFCLKSRSECLYFRGQLTNQTVKAPSIPEIVRKIESEQRKYSKLLSSLDPDVQSQGLELQEADMVMVLLRSLPEKCRSYCLLHGDSDSFEDLKRVALKFEVQQGVWSEGVGSKLSLFSRTRKEKVVMRKVKEKERKSRELEARACQKERRPPRIRYATTATKRGILPGIVGHLNETRMRKIILMVARLKGKQSPSLRVDRRITPKEKERT